ncbi:hypothetical protein BOTBODRAFT_168725 [Botryobasidium botryosum FD-172 SS1]|uniref:Uncharacterized protein n=1 Tax=Botryobasidium botryosum (strain FD-172 SS1) TaxID=930990 RepID=A0A067N0T4_BOTB1|nr:hypothetical protein BOTBODRAFT_168725 [Botryobasidium botryosum FD-172 SS1]
MSSTSSSVLPLPTSTSLPMQREPHHDNPVVSFIIGLAIITMASILNAGGLNLTKLDHVRTMSLAKHSRKKEWQRPLWVIGMLLYIVSQLIGSSLALEYMRAEYVAPLGSSSLIFNFMFASALIGTPVTRTDIYGTATVILGVIGIVAFGSINSGLSTSTDLEHLAHLWGRSGWIVYFIISTVLIALTYLGAGILDRVLAARAEFEASPFGGSTPGSRGASTSWWGKTKERYNNVEIRVRERMENWMAAKSDKTVAWTLAIGWACCGGAMAGGCLVFAKACVKLISGSLSHTNTGNQFIHPAAIITFLLLAVTAIFQIICLNRGLRVYDSTLVVPVFYGIYTASGFLNSLIFNNEVDSYKSWTLFLIALSILVLILGVVLLTNKKPEPRPTPGAAGSAQLGPVSATRQRSSNRVVGNSKVHDEEAGEGGGGLEDGDSEGGSLVKKAVGDDDVVWQIGDDVEDDSDDDVDGKDGKGAVAGEGSGGSVRKIEGEEGQRLISDDGEEDDHDHDHELTTHSTRHPTTAHRGPVVDDDEFGDWEEARAR